MLEIMLVHFISGPQHCVGCLVIYYPWLPLRQKNIQVRHFFIGMTPFILAVIELWGKHTVSVFSAYFLTAQNLKMKGVQFTKNFNNSLLFYMVTYPRRLESHQECSKTQSSQQLHYCYNITYTVFPSP